jgi:chorismate synthase
LGLTAKNIQAELDRRKSGQSKITTSRKETDQVEILMMGKLDLHPIMQVVF